MAVVMERTAANGVRVLVDDACYRDATPEEIERRYAEIWRAMCRIAESAAKSDRRGDGPAVAQGG